MSQGRRIRPGSAPRVHVQDPGVSRDSPAPQVVVEPKPAQAPEGVTAVRAQLVRFHQRQQLPNGDVVISMTGDKYDMTYGVDTGDVYLRLDGSLVVLHRSSISSVTL